MLRETVTGVHSGQIDISLGAWIDRTRLGYLDYSVFEGRPAIRFIEVREDVRRTGIATRLLGSLQARFPGIEIEWGYCTPDGAALHAALPVREIPRLDLTRHQRHRAWLARAERRMASSQARLRRWARLQAIEDRLSEIERSAAFRHPVLRLLALPAPRDTAAGPIPG